jgi:hypothetical protein
VRTTIVPLSLADFRPLPSDNFGVPTEYCHKPLELFLGDPRVPEELGGAYRLAKLNGMCLVEDHGSPGSGSRNVSILQHLLDKVDLLGVRSARVGNRECVQPALGPYRQPSYHPFGVVSLLGHGVHVPRTVLGNRSGPPRFSGIIFHLLKDEPNVSEGAFHFQEDPGYIGG